jgi:succinoglycan biosynthesis protein ExoM
MISLKNSGRTGKLHAAICLLTRRRPVMLRQALDSLAGMQIPENTDVTVIVVENDSKDSMRVEFDGFRARTGLRSIYLREERMGIPFARNHAVDAALAAGADVVLFFDDDEIADTNWLAELLARYRESNLDLIGGPVVASAADHGETWLQSRLRAGLARRFESRARKASRKLARGQERRITIVTNNWLASRSVFDTFGIRFDEAYAKTGGSDTKFYHDAVAAGVKSGWAPKAVVYETIPSERVTLGYVYRRGRDQKRTSVYRKLRKSGHVKSALRMLPEMVYRIMVLVPGPLLVILSGGRHLTSFVRSTGETVGLVTGFFGARSTLYEETTGH